ncbi:MAG: HEPN domain-containing protein [Desulfobacteraceae bacterium]|nr:HEPN domain-containing protein [Desulfobacteraceae bacterium]
MTTDFFCKAENNLNVAQLCFDNGFYDACANRAYYAALQAAVAALADKGIKKEKIDHRLVQAEFSSKLIRSRKIYSPKMKSYLMDMQRIRDYADYSGENISRKKAAEQLRKSEEMLTMIGKELKL